MHEIAGEENNAEVFDDGASETGDGESGLVIDPTFTDDVSDSELKPAPGVETVCFFPKNADKCRYFRNGDYVLVCIHLCIYNSVPISVCIYI